MKIKRITALALVCLLLTTSSCRKRKPGSEAVTPTEFAAVSSEEASSEYVQGHWFEPADCRVREVAPGMTVDEVKEILGNPELAYNVAATHCMRLSMPLTIRRTLPSRRTENSLTIRCTFITATAVLSPEFLTRSGRMNPYRRDIVPITEREWLR